MVSLGLLGFLNWCETNRRLSKFIDKKKQSLFAHQKALSDHLTSDVVFRPTDRIALDITGLVQSDKNMICWKVTARNEPFVWCHARTGSKTVCNIYYSFIFRAIEGRYNNHSWHRFHVCLFGDSCLSKETYWMMMHVYRCVNLGCQIHRRFSGWIRMCHPIQPMVNPTYGE